MIKLKSLREECGGCPTSFSGETVDGQFFEANLRNGYMEIILDDEHIVSCNPPELDGVCHFSDFELYAQINGFYIDDSEAEWSSQIQDTEKAIQEAFKDIVWVEFIHTFDSKHLKKPFEKGKRYLMSIKNADLFVDAKLAKVDDSSYERKKANYLKSLEEETISE